MNDKLLLIMRGIPGSGKSTRVQKILDRARKLNKSAISLSTDEYWGKEYKFNPAKLQDAHDWNFLRALGAMRKNTNIVIIDNTNIRKSHYDKYIEAGKKLGYKYKELIIPFSPNLAEIYFKRNTHKVPLFVIQRMIRDFEK